MPTAPGLSSCRRQRHFERKGGTRKRAGRGQRDDEEHSDGDIYTAFGKAAPSMHIAHWYPILSRLLSHFLGSGWRASLLTRELYFWILEPPCSAVLTGRTLLLEGLRLCWCVTCSVSLPTSIGRRPPESPSSLPVLDLFLPKTRHS